MPYKDKVKARAKQNEWHRAKYASLTVEERRANDRKTRTPARSRARYSKWKAKDPGHVLRLQRGRSLKRRYGLTQAEYDTMAAAQRDLCAVCGRPEAATRNGALLPLCVDHDHGTGAVRQLLCVSCNSLIGHAHDDVEVLRRAADYLALHKAVPKAPATVVTKRVVFEPSLFDHLEPAVPIGCGWDG